MKNSDFRQFANATQVEQSKAMRHLMTALAVIVPVTGVYAYRSGFFATGMFADIMNSMSGRSAPQVAAAPPAVAPAKAPASTQARSSSRDVGKGLEMALRMQKNMGLMFEMVAEQLEAFAPDGGSGPTVSSDRLSEYCRVQARRQINDRGIGGRGGGMQDTAMFDIMAERVYCMMTRRPEKLCEPAVKADMLKQFDNYVKIRDGALKELMGDPAGTAEGRSHMTSGVHKAISDELRKLAMRGYIVSGDFGWWPSEEISTLFASVKAPAQPPCKV